MASINYPGFTKTRIINSSIDKVFDLLADLVRLGECMEYVDRVEILTNQTRGLGTKAKWIKKTPKDNPTTWIEEVTIFEPPNRVGFETIDGENKIKGEISLVSITPTQTQITFHEEFLYPNPRLDQHNAGMENQLSSMRKCLETNQG